MSQYRKKILIVEDDNTLRNILSDQLARTYEIVQAEDGEKGLKFAVEFRPDLIILDLLLPNLSGFDMLKKLRENSDSSIANTKVIVFSNFATDKDIMQAKVLNVSDYLVKSNTSIDDLIQKISENLEKQ